jgi:hypothetical protein
MSEEKPRSAEQMKTPFSRSHQHEVKLQTILSEAARLFNYQGTRATTLNDIADSIGLTKTSFTNVTWPVAMPATKSWRKPRRMRPPVSIAS